MIATAQELAAAILHVRPGTEFSVTSDFDTLIWLSPGEPPGEAEVASALSEIRKPPLIDYCRQICSAKLAVGFDFDFGDDRGVHHIGTTERDLAGWAEVRALAAAFVGAGQPSAEIKIATDTGGAVIAASEWPLIDIAAGAFRQPIWAASFTIQTKIDSGLITTAAEIVSASEWPG